MFNLGFSELILLGAIALIFIGPKQLPQVARVVARTLNELKHAVGDLTSTFVQVRNDADKALRKTAEQILTPDEPVKKSAQKKPASAPTAPSPVADVGLPGDHQHSDSDPSSKA